MLLMKMLTKRKKKISTYFNIIVVIKRHRDNELFHCEAKGYIYMRHTIDITYMPSIGVISRCSGRNCERNFPDFSDALPLRCSNLEV